MTKRRHSPARRAARKSYHPEAWAGADDWAAADSEPLEAFESPRPHESVPSVWQPESWTAPPPLRPAWEPTATSPKRARMRATASVVSQATPPRRPTTFQRNVALFRPVVAPAQRTICQTREDRRSALFATGGAGKGIKHGPGSYVRKITSNYGCK